MVSREILIGSASGTNCSSSSAMPCATMLEAAVAPAVPHDIGRRLVTDRQRRRRPELAAVVIAHVEDLAGPVADRIVRPGRELVVAAVLRPGIAAALGRHLEAERRVGDDIDPGRRRRLARARARSRTRGRSGENPPRPLKNCSAARAATGGGSSSRAGVGRRLALGAAGARRVASGRDRVGRPDCRAGSSRTTRATASSRARVSAEIRSLRRTKMPPALALDAEMRGATGWCAPAPRARSAGPARRRRRAR